MASPNGHALSMPELTRPHFAFIRQLVYGIAGIHLHEGKENLVRARLSRRIRELGFDGFAGYLEHVTSARGAAEVPWMIDALTTNKTSFFREPRHFEFLRDTVLPPLVADRSPIRIWNAGCSSGEEPYTTAMVVRTACERTQTNVRILATDISGRMITAARAGVYGADAVAELPPQLLRSHFSRVAANPPKWAVQDSVRSLIRFARLNLMDEWPMRRPFDVIFCRNVMIYFDKPTQQRLVERFHGLLTCGGHLFVGHAESLSGIQHGFRYVQPAVYVKGCTGSTP